MLLHRTLAAIPARPGYRFYVLAILILVYMLNFLDRQIIGILAAPLKEEFGLSDSQFGLLGGIDFASVYSTLAIPLAWLADRMSRVTIMTGALAVWSGFTALCVYGLIDWKRTRTAQGAPTTEPEKVPA